MEPAIEPAIILDILFVLVAAIFIAVGVKRGFIKSLIQSAKLLLTIVATYFLGSPVAAFIREKFVFQKVYDFWFAKIDGIYQQANSSLNVEEFRATVESAPDFLLAPEKKAEILASLSEESGTAMVESVSNSLANPVADVISGIIGYALTFVVAFIVLTVAAWLLTKIAERFAIIGTANRILGGVFGAVLGAIVLMIVAVIVKFLDANNAIYPNTVVVKLLGDFIL